MKILAVALSALLPLAPAGAADWTLREGELRFSAVSQGERFEGRFADFSADIRFDPAELSGSRFEVAIRLGSADTENEERDQTLLGPDFFAIDEHPQASYLASSFRAVDGGFVAEGELSLRGVTRAVPLRFTWTRDGDAAVLEGEALLDRMAFAVGAGDWADPEMIGHEVRVSTRLELVPPG